MSSTTDESNEEYGFGFHDLDSDGFRHSDGIQEPEFPVMKIVDNRQGFLIILEVPDCDEDDLEVLFIKECLRISGWRGKKSFGTYPQSQFPHGKKWERFRRTFRFFVPVEMDQLQTQFEFGILVVWIPKPIVGRPEIIETDF